MLTPSNFPLKEVTLKKLKDNQNLGSRIGLHLMWGAHDEKYDSHCTEVVLNLKNQKPLLTFHKIPEAYHDPHRTHPAEISRILQGFLT